MTISLRDVTEYQPDKLPIMPWPEQLRKPRPVHPAQGCNATTCPNGKCRATGECIELAAERARQAEKHGG